MRLRITNARIIDGTGAPARLGELLIEDRHLAEVGEATLAADETLDAGGLAVAPGFIDVHSHSDFSLPVAPLAEPKILQGVTTEVIGNCGLGLTPANERVEQMYAHVAPLMFGERAESCSPSLAAYRQRLHDTGISVNAAMLVPHGNLRCFAMGLDERAPTGAELAAMSDLLSQEMEAGAFGLSSGLVYPPGAFASTEELITLARAVKPFHGIYATHMRDEGSQLVQAVTEALTIGREAGVGVQISHHKAAGRLNWGRVKTTLRMIDDARRQGSDVHCDVYPYTAGATVLAALALPPWAFEGDHDAIMARLRDPEARARIIRGGKERLLGFVTLPGPLRLIPKRWLLPIILGKLSELVVISSVKNNHALEGECLADIVRARGTSLFDTILDLLAEEDAAVMAIAHVMAEPDVRTVMQHPTAMIGSDGLPTQQGKPHPRTWGTFPRVLGPYVRDHRMFSVEEAVHRMTGLTAAKLGLAGRGTLTAGHIADVVLFDPDTVADQATYEEPRRPPLGIPHVMVAGTWTVRDGRHTGARAGRVLHRGVA